MDNPHKPSALHVLLSIVVVGVVVWLVMMRRDRGIPPTTPQTPSTEQVVSWPSFETSQQAIREENQYYSIEALYPVTRDARTSDLLKTFVEEQVAQFKSDTAWVMDPSIDSASSGALSLSVTYQENKSTYADTYVFTIVTYTGGAHGLQATRTYAFNEKGEVVTIDKLFTNGAKGLDTVAKFVQAEITKKNISDAEWIKEGAAASVENYQNFVISDTGVTFIFDPYSVAPYAAGVQNIMVPLSVFKSIANPELFSK